MFVPINQLHSMLTATIISILMLLTSSGCSSNTNDDSITNSPSFRLATVAVDSDADGIANSLFTWFYDAEGRAISEEFDAGVDGSVEARFLRVRDGNTLRIQRDESANGSIEGVASWMFNADGLPTSFAQPASEDGRAPESAMYEAENGMLVAGEIDLGADGSIDFVERYSYDANGHIAKVDFDIDGDNVTDDVLTVVREANGTVIRLNEDFGDDGGIDSVRILTYEEGSCDAEDISNLAASVVIEICL